ncbi:MAG: minor capsid protein [Polyangiaceae bacterium]|nr:minor capsid protein [Polyangiaceae bacterium]
MLRYHVAVVGAVHELDAILREDVLPRLELFGAPSPPLALPALRLDETALDRMLTRARDYVRRIRTSARWPSLALEVAEDVDVHAAEQLRRQVRAATGHDLLLRLSDIRGSASRWVHANVEAIAGLNERHLAEVEQLVTTAVVRGVRVEQLADEIRARTDVSGSRAAFLARDQVLRFNAQVTRERQVAAGITEYDWDSSDDERVRPRHEELHGTRQRWDTAPVVSDDGRRAHPGEDFQCRCIARPVLEGLLT